MGGGDGRWRQNTKQIEDEASMRGGTWKWAVKPENERCGVIYRLASCIVVVRRLSSVFVLINYTKTTTLNEEIKISPSQWGDYISSSQGRLLSSCFAIIVAQCRLPPQRRTLRVNSTPIWLDIALNHMEIHFSCYNGRPGLPFSSELSQRSASALQFVERN